MAKKRKKRQTTKRSVSQPSRRVVAALDEAMELFEDGHHDEAQARLVQLAQRYPRSKPVLNALLSLYYELQDWASFARYSEQLLPLERGHDRAEVLNNLVFAYTQLMFPALAWQTGKELIAQHPDFPDVDRIKTFVQSAETFLHEQAAELLGTTDLTLEDQMNVLIQHDRVRFYTESGQAEKAITAAESLLEKVPNLIPILNNLSLSHFVAGNTDQAVAAAERVLAQAPDNFHALANLTRYSFLTAQFDAARQYAARLKQVRIDNPDLEPKQAEALAFLGDDEGVRDAYQRAEERYDELPPLLLHLAAAAHYRLGDEKTAWRLWQEVVKREPSFSLAQENLADRHLPVGERDAPWYWSLPYWFSSDFRRGFDQLMDQVGRTKSNKAVESAARALLEKYPYMPRLFPHILDRGDRTARDFVINFTRIAETPELARALYDFALRQYGADDVRMEAMQFVSEHYPELLPEDKKVPMWLQGRQTEVFLMGFEIYHESEPSEDMADEILDMHEEAHDFLLEGEAEEAEQLLRQIIGAAPDFPSAYNQLAVAYQMQDRQEEARALVVETHARFPDYLFARVALARFYSQENRIEEAKDLLDPIMRLNRLHISEFRALAQAQMEIALADGNKDAAHSWLDMWEQVDEDHPDLLKWRMLIEGADSLLRNLQKLTDRLGRRRGR
ncbi:MAG TPA: hypothetical protein VF177_22280 [Anaerolineae bacterium]